MTFQGVEKTHIAFADNILHLLARRRLSFSKAWRSRSSSGAKFSSSDLDSSRIQWRRQCSMLQHDGFYEAADSTLAGHPMVAEALGAETIINKCKSLLWVSCKTILLAPGAERLLEQLNKALQWIAICHLWLLGQSRVSWLGVGL